MDRSRLRVIFVVFTFVIVLTIFLAMYTCSGMSCFGVMSTTPVSLSDYNAFVKGSLNKHKFTKQDLDKTRNIDLQGDDILVYLHMQKTGGATFGRHLVHNLDVNPPCKCIPGVKKCECFTANNHIWLLSRHSTGWVCGLHADWTELHDCVDQWFLENDLPLRRNRRYHWITFLRNPVMRLISEWQHVKRGATWKTARLYCNGRSATLKEVPFCYSSTNWKGVTFGDFLSCKYNLAFNRMTRMLANLTTVNCYNRTGLSEDFVRETLVSNAKQNLQDVAFFGIVEEQEMTQFLFERTFGLKFIDNFRQKSNTHVSRINMTDEMIEKATEANDLDILLYQYAKDLFYQRVEVQEKLLGYTVNEYFKKMRDVEEEESHSSDKYFEDEIVEEAEKEMTETYPTESDRTVRDKRGHKVLKNDDPGHFDLPSS